MKGVVAFLCLSAATLSLANNLLLDGIITGLLNNARESLKSPNVTDLNLPLNASGIRYVHLFDITYFIYSNNTIRIKFLRA